MARWISGGAALEHRLVTLRALLAAAVVAAVGLTACFDVRQVEPGRCGSLLIDDFEAADELPRFTQLTRWRCATAHPETQPFACDFEARSGGGRSLSLTFDVGSPSAAVPQPGGVGAKALVTDQALDLTPYRDLSLSAMLEAQQGLSDDASINVELGCLAARIQSPDNFGYANVSQQLPIKLGVGWMSFSFSMAGFLQPDDQPSPLVGGPVACLSRVDSLAIMVLAHFSDGQAASGVLHLDNVALDEPCAP
jgi:hypothetical protein